MKIQFAFISDSSFFLKKYWLYYSLIGQLQASTMDQTLFCAQNKKTSKSILAILNMVGTQVVQINALLCNREKCKIEFLVHTERSNTRDLEIKIIVIRQRRGNGMYGSSVPERAQGTLGSKND